MISYRCVLKTGRDVVGVVIETAEQESETRALDALCDALKKATARSDAPPWATATIERRE
jgi:hypothetical protein